VAPHPDDEALAASVVLQRAVKAGAAVRVVYATNGDDNPWPQRLFEKKWTLDAADRQRWGELRRGEALTALGILGLSENTTQFLGLPDQGLTELLLNEPNEIISRFVQTMVEWRPNKVLVPALCDTHPDHSALGVLARIALSDFALTVTRPQIEQWSYLVHGRSRIFARGCAHVEASAEECARKRSAILCHRTQVRLSRRRFLNYAARPERYAPLEGIPAGAVEGSIRSATRIRSTLTVTVRRQIKPRFAPGDDAVFVVGVNRSGRVRSWRAGIPARSGPVLVSDGSGGEVVGCAHFEGDAFTGRLIFSADLFSERERLFVKLHRPGWFFDEAGWIEIAAAPVPVPSPDRRGEIAVAGTEKYSIR
jgi:LmbE family N-acetylglucosaminyl deacetylase